MIVDPLVQIVDNLWITCVVIHSFYHVDVEVFELLTFCPQVTNKLSTDIVNTIYIGLGDDARRMGEDKMDG